MIDCEATSESIRKALTLLFSREFSENLKTVENPYSGGRVAETIINHIRSFPLDDILRKKFFDYPSASILSEDT